MLAGESCYCQSNQNMKIQKKTNLIRLLKITNGTEFLNVFFHTSKNKY